MLQKLTYRLIEIASFLSAFVLAIGSTFGLVSLIASTTQIFIHGTFVGFIATCVFLFIVCFAIILSVITSCLRLFHIGQYDDLMMSSQSIGTATKRIHGTVYMNSTMVRVGNISMHEFFRDIQGKNVTCIIYVNKRGSR